MIDILALPVVGFLIGLFIITLGGGGAVYVGVLTVFFNIPPAIAASTSLATMIPTTAMGAFSHARAGNLNIRLGLYMVGGGAAGAVVGSACSGLLPHSMYDKISGLFIVGITLQMLVQFLRQNHKAPDDAPEAPATRLTSAKIVKAGAYDLFGGLLSSLIGISGSPAIVVGLSVLGYGAAEIAGTSAFVLLGVAGAGFLLHLRLGTVDWPLAGLFLSGTLSGAFIGPRVLKRINGVVQEKVLRPLFFILMVGTGLILALR